MFVNVLYVYCICPFYLQNAHMRGLTLSTSEKKKNKVKLALSSQKKPQKGPKNRPQKWASCMQFVRYKLILQPSNTDST